jgi:hypothetical protein
MYQCEVHFGSEKMNSFCYYYVHCIGLPLVLHSFVAFDLLPVIALTEHVPHIDYILPFLSCFRY